MLSTLRHRAPDGADVAGDKRFYVGMGRLAIIDLKSPGLCPFVEDGYTLAFNGEIYNYRELRSELEQLGHIFRTKSDTEVLYRAYRQWGIKCLNKFNGMFAFALCDGQHVILARDIAGEKPLYYRKNSFAFASELKALFATGPVDELEPAHYLIYDITSGKISVRKYWKLEQRDINVSEAVDELEFLLADSIRLRTRADVPYGLYYSGGIDSSLIRTFHDFAYEFTYQDADYREEFLELLPKIVYHLDGPIASFSPFGLWKLAEQAYTKKVRVVLSGEGADELFGGYVRYVPLHFNYIARQQFPSYEDMFKPARSVTSAGWDEFNGNMRHLLRMGDRMASAFGIENRCPFLDRRIIEFAYSLPDYMKIQGLKTKVILRQILERRNPEYQDIEKKGLYCSVNEWIGSKEKFTKYDYLNRQSELWAKIRDSRL